MASGFIGIIIYPGGETKINLKTDENIKPYTMVFNIQNTSIR